LTKNTIPEKAELGNAKYLGSWDSSDPLWHEARAGRIGGSEVGAIVGASRYESAYSLWAKKLGLIDSQKEENDFMYWGKALEPVVIDRFAKEHPELTVLRDVGTWVSKANEKYLANPDAILEKASGDYGILEIKTARYSDDWANGVPQYYMTQVQWYLAVFGFSYAYVAVLFAGSEYREFTIEANKFWQEADEVKVAEFLNCIATEQRPDWDGSEATVQAVKQQHPDIEASVSIELGELGLHYSSALDELEKAKEQSNKLQSQVLDAMGNAKTGVIYDTPAFIRSSRKGGTPYLTRKRGS
jgi:putative phage-type endonuclease